MPTKIKIITVKFENTKINAFDIPKFRGYLAHKYPKYDLIHNHLTDGRFRYAYPSIQFKVLEKIPTILGIGQGIDILKKVFMEIDELIIEGRNHQINEKSILLNEVEFGHSKDQKQYEFISPWMALNQQNYAIYQTLEWNKKRSFLENILSGNLKSLSKGFDYFIPGFDNLYVQANLNPMIRKFKGVEMTCFTGTFSTNFFIPDYLGIGKQTARGFGTIVSTM